jgi:hypothetical protein
MSKDNLPTYVIVELLIRLAPYNALIGDYKNHTTYDEGVMVKTSEGTIHFPKSLITEQFKSPELVNDETLTDIALSFKPFKPVS